MLGPVAAGILLATIAPAGARLRRGHVPDRDGPDRPHATVAALERRERGELGSDQGRLPLPQRKADAADRLPGRSQRDDLRFPIALFPAVVDRLGEGPAVLGFLYAAPAVGSFVATMVSGRAKHVRRQAGRSCSRSRCGAVRSWCSASPRPSGCRSRCSRWPVPATWVSGIFRSTILQAAVEDRLCGRLDGHRHGRVGDRAIARKRGVGRRGVGRERAVLDRVGRPAHDRRRGGAATVRAWVLALRRPRSEHLKRSSATVSKHASVRGPHRVRRVGELG